MKNKNFGWKPDFPDKRDKLYSSIKKQIPIPNKVDLRLQCSPVEDQGDLGSCTAQALVANLEFLLLIQAKKDKTQRSVEGKSYYDLSRLFVYYNERVIEGSVNEDAGAQIRDGIKTLAKQGACVEDLWPYKIEDFAKKPKPECYKDAKLRKILKYHRLITLSDMVNCLADGYPFVYGFTVYESFDSPPVAKTGVVNMPAKKEGVLGGHAVMAVGYDKDIERFIVRNSWGKKWGRDGYFTMPFEYIETLADDFWVVKV